jgi:hypothetical protein
MHTLYPPPPVGVNPPIPTAWALGPSAFAFAFDWGGTVTVPGELGGRYGPVAMQGGKYPDRPPP